MRVRTKKLRENAVLPTFGTPNSAGGDLRACVDEKIGINPGETAVIPTGLAFEIPEGWFGAIYARSGLACKQGLRPANCVAVIDSDYRGEVMVVLRNDSSMPRIVNPGDRIAQMVLTPYLAVEYEEVPELDETERGTGGFGSTGTR